jgi:hypothetical protein
MRFQIHKSEIFKKIFSPISKNQYLSKKYV